MDPLNWKRALLLAILGVAAGFGAAMLVEATDAHPLFAPGLTILAAAAVAFWLRKCELLNCLVKAAVFTYGTFIGMSLLRANNNYLDHNYPNAPLFPSGLLHEGLNAVVLAVGIPYTFAVVLIIALPVWSLAQISRQRMLERDEHFWNFIDERTRR